MEISRSNRVFDICRGALDRSGSDRAAYVDSACGGDSTLREAVESLLAAEARAGSFLVPPPSRNISRLLEPEPAEGLVGRRMGSYTITGLLGRGGMGIVYEAQQDNPSRLVALKVMRALPYMDEATPRIFEREGQALARLAHTGIAAIHDAGHVNGWYYFAMERVAGSPLTEYAHEHGLSIRGKIELMRRVCDAVQYAHQHGVIHRDLKPSNILVTESGGPKVLDFGLARITEPGVDPASITEPGSFQGTLAYASPEQVRGGRPGEVDVRSDVYSLGVVLYELLCGAPPYEVAGKSLAEAASIVCERAPRPARTLNCEVRGELETILGKALDKDPDRRYVSAAALADDLDRYLHQRPILAHPPSAGYLLRKLVLRHKLVFTTAALALTAVLALTAGLAVLYVHSRASEQSSRRSAATATRVKDFMLGVFGAQDPDLARGENLTAEELLARGEERVETDLGGEPLVMAEVLASIGNVRKSRGEYARAAELLERSLEIRRRELGEDDQSVALTRADYGDALRELNRYEPARAQYEAALATLERTQGPDHESVAMVLSGLAETIRDSEPKRAEALHRRALEIRRARLGDDHPDVAESLSNLGVVLRRQGDNLGAETCYRRALPILLKHYGEDRIVVAHTYNSLGVALRYQERFDEAEQAYLAAQRIYRKLWHGRHPQLAASIASLGQLNRLQGRSSDAERNLREALAMQRELVGDVHLKVADCLNLLGSLVSAERADPQAAMPLRREELAICRALLPPNDIRIGAACYEASGTLSALGQHDEAVALMREHVRIEMAARGPDGRMSSRDALRLGLALLDAGILDEAETLLRDVTSRADESTDPATQRQSLLGLGQCMAARGRWDEARTLLLSARQREEEALRTVTRQTAGKRYWIERDRAATLEALIGASESLGKSEEAQAFRAELAQSRAVLDRVKAGQAP